MNKSIVVLKKKNLKSYEHVFNKNVPIYIVKKFFSKNECKELINFCSRKNFLEYHRKKIPKFFNFFSIDVMPSNVATNRILRWFELSNYTINYFKCVKQAVSLQKKIIKKKKILN